MLNAINYQHRPEYPITSLHHPPTPTPTLFTTTNYFTIIAHYSAAGLSNAKTRCTQQAPSSPKELMSIITAKTSNNADKC